MAVAPYAAVATPELIGVLAWWAVLFAAPLLFVRRWRRRRSTTLSKRSAKEQPAGNLRPTQIMPVTRGESEARSSVVEMFEPLCRYVDFHRRLQLAMSELEGRLSVLPADRWRIECYPLTGERGNTLLVLGETGVFVISATYAPGHWDDVITVNRLARKIQALVPGYAGQVRPAICHPFASVPPRLWYREDEDGEWIDAWVIGGDSAVAWLEHFGRDHRLSPIDLVRFDELSKPNWLRPAIPASPTWPPLLDGSRSSLEE